MLILDDVQLLAGRERTQEEFFHTFNTLYESRRQIVLTSDKVPKDIPDLEERLRNRFEWGLIADIQPPDIETRVAIIEQKAELEGYPAAAGGRRCSSPSKFASNVRELEGSLTRLGALASLGRQPDHRRVRPGSRCKISSRTARSQVTVDVVQKAVCEQFGIRLADMKLRQAGRKQHRVAPAGRNVSLPAAR